MSYHISDEPSPGGLSNWAVHPMWPLLAVMFGGAWLSWPWFAWNAFAVGSPTRRRELVVAIAGFAGSVGLAFALAVFAVQEVLTGVALRYAIVSVTVWKLAVSYWLYSLQGRSFHLFEHYGGVVRNGLLVVLLGGMLGRRLVLPAVDSGLWRLVVS
jgi:hypothetical protein